jgi:hypothetical protein
LRKWQVETNDPLYDKEKLERLTLEMDSVVNNDSEINYKRNSDFRWGYLDYLKK